MTIDIFDPPINPSLSSCTVVAMVHVQTRPHHAVVKELYYCVSISPTLSLNISLKTTVADPGGP